MIFAFEFENRYRPLLALLGVTPWTSRVEVSDGQLQARFGPWSCTTPLGNIVKTCQSGPYLAVKAIGARLSFADQGATFGTTTAGGVCVEFVEPVKILDPTGLLRHPGLTLTVADRDGFEAAIRAGR